jgi:hypothetical protein
MTKLNIGITLAITTAEESMFVTGIIQNVMNLAKVLSNSTKDYNIVLFNTAEEEPGTDLLLNSEPICNVHSLPMFTYSSIFSMDIDVLFTLGGELRDTDIPLLKAKGTKVVYYNCGSRYQLHILDVVFRTKKEVTGVRSYSHLYDAFWTIPQVVPSHFYHKIMHRIDPIVIPFVYDNIFLDKFIEENNLPNKARYIPKKEAKRISIMEVNREWIKYWLYPAMITELVYRQHPELIRQISINNAYHLKENAEFNHALNQLDVWNTDKVHRYINGWYPTPSFLEAYTDVVVSHQENNPLNYFYLDALYLGYPLIHNASLIKEAGYYYNDYDGEEGAHQLITALKYHDKNIEKYEEQSKKTLWRFSVNNPEIIEKYDDLIFDLFLKKR